MRYIFGGKNYYIAIPPPPKWPFFRGGNQLYSDFSAYPGKGGKWLYNTGTDFSYIVAVIFIDGGNSSTRRKPPTCRKSMTNFIT
jgi:hypothetical protein